VNPRRQAAQPARASSPVVYFVTLPSGLYGVTEGELASALAAGRLPSATPIWTVGMQDWTAIRDVPAFRSAERGRSSSRGERPRPPSVAWQRFAPTLVDFKPDSLPLLAVTGVAATRAPACPATEHATRLQPAAPVAAHLLGMAGFTLCGIALAVYIALFAAGWTQTPAAVVLSARGSGSPPPAQTSPPFALETSSPMSASPAAAVREAHDTIERSRAEPGTAHALAQDEQTALRGHGAEQDGPRRKARAAAKRGRDKSRAAMPRPQRARKLAHTSPSRRASDHGKPVLSSTGSSFDPLNAALD
jgi:hypothetical protein